MNRNSNLLIVDDEWVVADSLSRMEEWSDRNIRVIGTASNGQEALQWMNREKVDLLITDIQMPGMNGLELLQAIHTQSPQTSVICISGYKQFEYAKVALRYNAKGYVLKPIDTDELLTIVDEIIQSTSSKHTITDLVDRSIGDEASPGSYHEMLIAQAKAYMHEKLSEPLTLNEVARKACLTSHYFGQVFKTVTGHHFTSYLTQLRMEKAIELLKNPMLKNYEISRRIGYRDEKYFTKVFLRYYKVSPREYRKRYLSNRF